MFGSVHRSGGWLLLVFALAALSCSSDSDDSSAHQAKLVPCDPLADAAQPIALATILAAGKDKLGVFYVVDQADDYRVFVSEGEKLVRQRVAGSGIEGDVAYTFSVLDHDPPFTLKVELGATIRMGVLFGPLASKTFVIGQQGEELQVVANQVVAAMPVENLPGQIVVEYAATLLDQRWMVVIRPRDDWAYEDFRLFLGPTEELTERTVTKVVRALDGGSTTIDFDLGGAKAVASFPVEFDGTTFKPGPATLQIGDETSALTRNANDAPPAAASYLCQAR